VGNYRRQSDELEGEAVGVGQFVDCTSSRGASTTRVRIAMTSGVMT